MLWSREKFISLLGIKPRQSSPYPVDILIELKKPPRGVSYDEINVDGISLCFL
jgi:hypothetical protein